MNKKVAKFNKNLAKTIGSIYGNSGHEVIWCDKCNLLIDIKPQENETGLHGPSFSHGMFCSCNSKTEEAV